MCLSMFRQGVEVTVHDAGSLPLSKCVDINNLGPQQLPRLWSCIHDACMYNDPLQAAGGKVGAATVVAVAVVLMVTVGWRWQ